MKALILLATCIFLAHTFANPLSQSTVTQQLLSLTKNLFQKKLGNDSCTQSCCASLKSRSPQTYHYYQKTGHFKGGSGQYAIDTHCYSGQGKGLNNPDMQCVSNTGPLPASTYKLASCVNVMHSTVQRPCAFYLEPQKQSEMCGRSAFFIHGCACCTTGDDTNPPTAGCSAGCVVMSYINRKKLRIGDTLIVQHTQSVDTDPTILQA